MVASVRIALFRRHNELLFIAFGVGRSDPNYHAAFTYLVAEMLLRIILEVGRVLKFLRPFEPRTGLPGGSGLRPGLPCNWLAKRSKASTQRAISEQYRDVRYRLN